MTTMTDTALAERFTLFDRAVTYALDVLGKVRPADLDRPTPCTLWTVRAVMLHIADSADAAHNLTITGELAMPTPRASTTPDPVATAADRIHALRDRLAGMGPADPPADMLPSAAQIGATELAVHSWDIATALVLDRPIPDEVATKLLALIDGRFDDATRGSNFGPAVAVDPAASPSDRLVAYLGRARR